MTVRFSWNDQVIEAREGDSIAAALAEAGLTIYGHSRQGRARGPYCGMGACQDCLVMVDGLRGFRACMTDIEDGMRVAPQADTEINSSFAESVPPAQEDLDTDLAVIGAGPAGLQAAIIAREGGLSVIVIDERGDSGGQYFKPRGPGYRGKQPPDDQHRRGTALRRRAAASGAVFRTKETVWDARAQDDGFELRANGPETRARIRARAVILATGAIERPAMVPGWTLPGVMAIGAAQTLVRRYGVAPGRRTLVAGHGPLGIQLGAELLRAGAKVAAVADRARLLSIGPLFRMAASAPRLTCDGAGYLFKLLMAGVPVLDGWQVVEVLGNTQAEGAKLRCLKTGNERDIEADAICISDGFAPQTELARLLGVPMQLDAATCAVSPQRDGDGSTAIPGLWIAGDAGGLGGAVLAETQGQMAAAAALRHLSRTAPDLSAAQRRTARARAFQKALWDLFGAPARTAASDETVICRCEEVTAGSVRAAIALGASDPGAVKRATRAGMGRCQGRYCTPPLLRLLVEAGRKQSPESLFAPQSPIRPLQLGQLADEKPEWGGHRESIPSGRPHRRSSAPLSRSRTDLAVIGAGVTGVSAALFAARRGADVVCLDRGRINGEASGGNAGSLHLQLLSWDFGDKAVAGGSPQLQTLPLQKESIALWTDLEESFGADFELRITGGLMVAESEEQIAFLEAKAAAEFRMGISTEVVGADRVREIVPEISHEIVAGAWCAGEGKINPLIATRVLAEEARSAGAEIEEQTPVTALSQEGREYLIETPRGTLTADRVLIAAGGWSAEVAKLLGVQIPVRGAPLQMLVTDAAPPMLPCLIAHADRHLTMKQVDSGNILIGGAWTAVTGQSGLPKVLPESVEGNAWVAVHTVPALACLSVIRSWAAMNIDIDGAPIIGPVPGHPRVTVAATANGYTLGPLMGREAADIALSGRTRQDIAAFSMDRFH